MHPGPPVQPSRCRPPRRQHLNQQQLHRECNRQQQQQEQERYRSHLPHGHSSRVLLMLLLLASNPVILAQAEPAESHNTALAASTTQCQQTSTTHRNLWSTNNDTAIQRNLTIGYLTAIKGGLKDRQGLAISGALTMALDEINNDPNILPNVRLVMRWNDTRGETVEATRAMINMICDGIVAFFGPEGSCFVEAIVSESRNIPMLSYALRYATAMQLTEVISVPSKSTSDAICKNVNNNKSNSDFGKNLSNPYKSRITRENPAFLDKDEM